MTIGCKNKSETAPQVTPNVDYNTTAIINVNYPAVFEKKLLFDGKTIKKEKNTVKKENRK